MDVQYPLWLPLEHWQEYIRMRKSIKKPLTKFAEKIALDKLDRLHTQGQDPKAVLEQSIFLCWQGLFPVKDMETNKQRTDWDALMREPNE